jgi:HlyD family secretion protein
MTASVDIEVARRANVLVAPVDAVLDAAGREPWVMTIDGLRAVRKPVKLGIRGEGRVEIVEGVAPGDRLIAPAEGAIRPGRRVRAVTVTRIGAS